MTDNCVFCRILAGTIPATTVYSDELLIAIRDISPQAPQHIVLIPRRHIPTTLDLTAADSELLGRIHTAAAAIAREQGFAADGFRIVNNCNRDGGQTVWHLHFHLLAGRQLEWPPG